GGGGMAPDDGNGDSPVDEEPLQAGEIRLANQTNYDMESAYLHVDEDGERIVRAVVVPGTEAIISDGELSAGTQVEFDLVLQIPTSEGLRVRRKAKIVVDGDIIVTAVLVDELDPFSLAVSTGL
ncbi:MAG: hypothetical protein HOC05_14500, partial [Gemmatimonadetes bacterium]|nr:hypothetical protein [Gemmatimonadota bacterium]